MNIGDRFGRLTIIGSIVTKNGKLSYSPVRCDCGKEWLARRTAIRSGRIRSCGCLGKELRLKINTKHGRSSRRQVDPAYTAWAGMIQRCYNPNAKAYQWYGARGITVCDAWRDFPTFLADMGERPPGLSLERNDNSRGYEPGNCRWATHHEQMRNTRRNRMVTLGGETMCVTDAAIRIGVPRDRIYWRTSEHQVTSQEAVNFYARQAGLLSGSTQPQ